MTLPAAPDVQEPRRALSTALQPALRPQVNIHPQLYRGHPWYLLSEGVMGNRLLLDRSAYEVVRTFDGKRSVADILALDEALDEDAMSSLLATLADAEMLKGADPAARGSKQSQRVRWLQKLSRPFAVQIPLFDPDRVLHALLPLGRVLFSTPTFALWLLICGLAAVAAVNNSSGLAEHWQSRFLDPANLFWVWLAYPLVKGCHEMAHGLAARRWGAEVHEMGVMLLIFMPVPYVDASATGAFYAARHRMVVAAAGIMTECLLAALALFGWLQLEPGWLRDMLFNVMVVGGISTLLFNGNPLLRFDGYYVFADALEIPNLGTRAQRYLGYLYRRYLLGLEEPDPHAEPGEKRWLFAYGLASGIYRLFISFTIALFVASQFFVFGLCLAAWFLVQQILRPTVRHFGRTVPMALRQRRLLRFGGAYAAGVALICLTFFVVPVRYSTLADGIIMPPEGSVVRAGASGFVSRKLATTEVAVTAGSIVLELADTELGLDLRRLEAEREEARAELGLAMSESRLEAQRQREKIARLESEIVQREAEMAGLVVRAPLAGKFTPATDLAPGTYLRKGDIVGYLTYAGNWRIRTLVAQDDIGDVVENVTEINAAALSKPSLTIRATVYSEKPLAVDRLPSRALGTLGGGAIAVDARDPDGIRLLQPMFEVELALPTTNALPYRVGQRYMVRFVHHSEPVGFRLLVRLQNLLRQLVTR